MTSIRPDPVADDDDISETLDENHRMWMDRLYYEKQKALDLAGEHFHRIAEARQRLCNGLPDDICNVLNWEAFQERAHKHFMAHVRDLQREEARIWDAIRRNVKYVFVPGNHEPEEVQQLRRQLAEHQAAFARLDARVSGWHDSDGDYDDYKDEKDDRNEARRHMHDIERRLETLVPKTTAERRSVNYPWR